MAKKRTRKNKNEARHPFLIDWEEAHPESSIDKPVKRNLKNEPNKKYFDTNKDNKTKKQDNLTSPGSDRHGIAKAVLTAIFILGIELVLYLTL